MYISIEEVLKNLFTSLDNIQKYFWPRYFYPKIGRIQPFWCSFSRYVDFHISEGGFALFLDKENMSSYHMITKDMSSF